MSHHESSVLSIDCEGCRMAATAACTDCLVTYVCDDGAGAAVVVDLHEYRAIRSLQRHGLLPEHRRASG